MDTNTFYIILAAGTALLSYTAGQREGYECGRQAERERQAEQDTRHEAEALEAADWLYDREREQEKHEEAKQLQRWKTQGESDYDHVD